MNEDYLKQPIEVENDLGHKKLLTFSPDQVLYSNVDGVPVARFFGGTAFGFVRFDIDPPQYTTIDTRDGFRVSEEEFVRLIKDSRANP